MFAPAHVTATAVREPDSASPSTGGGHGANPVARRDGRTLRYSVGDPRVADLILLVRSLADGNAAVLGCCPASTRLPPQRQRQPGASASDAVVTAP